MTPEQIAAIADQTARIDLIILQLQEVRAFLVSLTSNDTPGEEAEESINVSN